MNIYEKELQVAKDIARMAGKIMLQYFDGDQSIQRKADNSLVTIADTKINRLVIEELSKHFTDEIIGEEESKGGYGMGRKWFCDPIDGTKAYVWGTPTAMFSLGLVIDGSPVLGVAYDPFLDKLYEGVVGGGSYCNGVKLEVSESELSGSTVAVASTLYRILEEEVFLNRLKEKKVELAMFSGAVYKACLVAKGRTVGFHGVGVNAHDLAAVHVIIEEAGGKITNLKGEKLDYTKPFKGALVSNGKVHGEILVCFND